MNSYQSTGGGYQSMQMTSHQQQQMRKQLKKKLSIIFRDRDEIPHRKGVNSIIVDNTNMSTGQSLLFTASRDRLIKLWHVNYQKKEYELKANLDEHTDWVNQIHYNPTHQILFSCSNDTTIKVWSINQTLQDLSNKSQDTKRLSSIITLNDDSDYVRAIDYSQFKNRLYSACDDGIVRMWDVNLGKIISQINSFNPVEEQRISDKNLLQRSNELLKIDQALPTSVSCSQGGSVVAIGYTDEAIRVIDMRIKNSNRSLFSLQGDHTDMIKQVQLSPEGMVCLSAGSDCSFKVWDLSTRKCIKSYGVEEGASKKNSTYHKDTINTFDVQFDSDLVFTGGRDGTIFENKIVKDQYSQIYLDPRKTMITSIKYDEQNEMLWYSTPYSDVQCLKYQNQDKLNEDSEPYNRNVVSQKSTSNVSNYMALKGLPQITEYHILTNKRYILTNSTDRDITANLWSLDNGQIIKSWKNEKYEDVKKFVRENYDIGGINCPVKKSDVVPQSWFTCDIKLGSLTIHLDEDNWLKGNVIDNDTNIERMLQGSLELQKKNSQDQQIDFNKSRQKSQPEVMQKALNLGFNLSEKLFKQVQKRYTEYEQKKIQKILGSNYQDFVRLKDIQSNKQEERKDSQADQESLDRDKMPLFTFLMEAESQKPIWTSYGDNPLEVDKFVHYLPPSMKKHIQLSIPNLDSQQKISVSVNTVHVLDLPKFQEGKRLTCAPNTPLFELIQFLSGKLEFQKQFLMPESQFDPLKYVEMVLPVKYPQYYKNQNPDFQQDSDKPYDDLIVLDQNLTLVIVQKLLVPYSGMNPLPQGATQLSSMHGTSAQQQQSQQLNILYRKKQIDYSKTIGYRSQGNSASKGIMRSSGSSTTLQQQQPNDGDSTVPTNTIETFRNLSPSQSQKQQQNQNATSSTTTPDKTMKSTQPQQQYQTVSSNGSSNSKQQQIGNSGQK